MDVFRADFENVLEIGGDVGDFVLEKQDDILVVLAFLVGAFGLCGVLGLGEVLEGGDLLV